MTDLHGWITQQVDQVEQLLDENEWPPSQEDGVRLRCEADRRILERHRLPAKDQWGEDEWAWTRDPACHGCGTSGDCDDPVTDNLNQCPELLDLAHAHGLTDETLASLDQPQMPERPRPKPSAMGQLAAELWDGKIRTALSDVPAALRGPSWKGTS